jgi:hypothetical protein
VTLEQAGLDAGWARLYTTIAAETNQPTVARIDGELVLDIPTNLMTGENALTNDLSLTLSYLRRSDRGVEHLPINSLPQTMGSAVTGDAATAPAVDGTVLDAPVEGHSRYRVRFVQYIELAAGENRFESADIVSRISERTEDFDDIVITPAVAPISGAMTITLQWTHGSDMDLHSRYYPNWPANADTSVTGFSAGVGYHVYYANQSALGTRVQDWDCVCNGLVQNARFEPEHHTWATVLTDQLDANGQPIRVVADGTYLISVDDYSRIDGQGVMVSIEGPGITQQSFGPFNYVGDAPLAHDPQPVFMVQVANHQIVRVEPMTVGEAFPQEVQDALGNNGFFRMIELPKAQ